MISSTRAIELPPDAHTQGFVLRYGFQRGLVVTYRSCMTMTLRLGDEQRTPRVWQSLLRINVIGVDEADGGARLVVHHIPLDGSARPAVIYIKSTEFGEPIESTDPSGGVNLVLPRMAVQTGSAWREIESISDPIAFAPVDVVRHYRIESLRGDQVTISFASDAATFDLDMGLQQVRTSSGTFGFDATYGVLTRQEVRSHFAVDVGEVSITADIVHALALSDS